MTSMRGKFDRRPGVGSAGRGTSGQVGAHARVVGGERGVALILALLILLVLSTLATTIAFVSDLDFQSMSSYKRGQQSFLAAERCIEEARRMFEIVGIEIIYFNLQGGQSSGTAILLDDGSYCRTGDRFWTNPDAGTGQPPAPAEHPPLVSIPPPTKVTGRPLKHVSLPSGGAGGAALVPATFTVVGKDPDDRDKFDTDPTINTGTEIAVGLENFIPGGATNVY